MALPVPTKLTPEVATTIVAALATGCYRHEAAEAAGIHRNTLKKWLGRGKVEQEDPQSLYADLYHKVVQSESKARLLMLAAIRKAGSTPKHWTALAWLIERRDPENWGREAREIRAMRAELKELRTLLDELRASAV